MGRCEPRTNENDPGLITLPEGIDELGDAVKSEFDVTTKQVCRALQCTRPFRAVTLQAYPAHLCVGRLVR